MKKLSFKITVPIYTQNQCIKAVTILPYKCGILKFKIFVNLIFEKLLLYFTYYFQANEPYKLMNFSNAQQYGKR